MLHNLEKYSSMGKSILWVLRFVFPVIVFTTISIAYKTSGYIRVQFLDKYLGDFGRGLLIITVVFFSAAAAYLLSHKKGARKVEKKNPETVKPVGQEILKEGQNMQKILKEDQNIRETPTDLPTISPDSMMEAVEPLKKKTVTGSASAIAQEQMPRSSMKLDELSTEKKRELIRQAILDYIRDTGDTQLTFSKAKSISTVEQLLTALQVQFLYFSKKCGPYLQMYDDEPSYRDYLPNEHHQGISWGIGVKTQTGEVVVKAIKNSKNILIFK